MSSVRQKMAAVQKAQNKSEEEVAKPTPEKKAAPKKKAASKAKAKAKAKSAPKGKK